MKEILDMGDEIPTSNDLWEPIKWWETHRLLYTGILLFTEIAMMATNWPGTVSFGARSAIVQSILYTIAANGFYSMGWGVELLFEYYFKTGSFFKK